MAAEAVDAGLAAKTVEARLAAEAVEARFAAEAVEAWLAAEAVEARLAAEVADTQLAAEAVDAGARRVERRVDCFIAVIEISFSVNSSQDPYSSIHVSHIQRRGAVLIVAQFGLKTTTWKLLAPVIGL